MYSYVRNLVLPFLRPAVFRPNVGNTDTCLPRHPVFPNSILCTDPVYLSLQSMLYLIHLALNHMISPGCNFVVFRGVQLCKETVIFFATQCFKRRICKSMYVVVRILCLVFL